MNNYSLETKGKTLKGIIICGAREGYTGTKENSLDEVLDALDDINQARKKNELPIPSCMVSEAILIGRSQEEKYREKVYKFEFSWSPRAKPTTETIFHEALVQYVNALGSKLKQERVYLEFDGKTWAYKQNTDCKDTLSL